jgi:hypothetical protein
MATVLSLSPDRPVPKGTVVFYADNKAVTQPVPVDAAGNARWKVSGLEKGDHNLKAVFIPGDENVNHGSVSAGLIITVLYDDPKTDDNGKDGGIGKAGGTGTVFSQWWFWVILLLLIIIIILLVAK